MSLILQIGAGHGALTRGLTLGKDALLRIELRISNFY